MKQIAPPPGVKDLGSLITFLENVKEFKKQLAEMEDLRNELNEMISAHGKIKEIDASLARQRSAEIQADANIRNAEVAAKVMLDDSAAEIERYKKVLSDRTKGQTKREDQVASGLQQIERRETLIAEQVVQISTREQRCAERESEAAALRSEYEERLARIKAAAAG